MSPPDRRAAGWLLVLAPLPLFTTGSLYIVPFVLMALLGATHLTRSPHRLRTDPGARLVAGLFLALWIPQLLALPGAAAPGESLQAALLYPTFALAAVYILRTLRRDEGRGPFAAGVVVVVSLWALDVIPGATGLVEWPVRLEDPRRIEGAVVSRFSLGHLAATLSPVVHEIVRRRRHRHRWLLILPALLAAVVLLSGRRAAWLMWMLATGAYGLHLLARGWTLARLRRIATVGLPAVGLAALLAWQHDGTRERLAFTGGLFSDDREAVDVATSRRLDIWATALRAARANGSNGIGPRAFSEVYGTYAADDDFWLRDGRTGAAHPHLFVLEVAVETGLPGLLGYGVALWLLTSRLARAPPGTRSRALPLGIAAGVALFPLNVHTALFAARWSAVSWWFVGLLAAVLSRSGDVRAGAATTAGHRP